MLVTIDFETFFDAEHSLGKMSTSEYVRAPEFEVLMCAIKIDDGPATVYVGHAAVVEALGTISWSEAEVLCHNTMFDAFILTQVYGHYPAKYRDTLAMVRAQFPYWPFHNLNACGENLNLGGKLGNVLPKLKGKHLPDLDVEEIFNAVLYCKRDAELCHSIFKKLEPGFPNSELELISMTTRLFCEPKLCVDVERASRQLAAETMAKNQSVEHAHTNRSVLLSNNKFASALWDLGVESPTKISPTTGNETWAFSKSDAQFKELLEHPDARVVALCKARLKVKSTIGETRAKRFVVEGQHHTLPVGLRYYGAHTGRWSGTNKINLQNLPRGGELRKSIMAPAGHVIVVADLSQIECRMNAWLAGEMRLLDAFRDNKDVYSDFASLFYGFPVDKDKFPRERFVGKTCVLGLGYQMGPPKLQFSLENGKPAIKMDIETCKDLVKTYRSAYPCISNQWQQMQSLIAAMSTGKNVTYGPLEFGKWHVRLPNGMALQYWQLESVYEEDREGYPILRSWYKNGRGSRINLYGGKLTENIVQALCRIIMSDAMLRIDREIQVVMHSHDEIAAIVPESIAQASLDFMIREMTRVPTWCSGIPLAAEGGFDKVYSK